MPERNDGLRLGRAEHSRKRDEAVLCIEAFEPEATHPFDIDKASLARAPKS